MADDDESKRLAEDYVNELRERNLAQSPQDKRAAISRYWDTRGPMFRSLAQLVVSAVNQGLDGDETIRWAQEQFGQSLFAKAKTDSQRRQFASWLEQRRKFLRDITVQLWASASRAVPPHHGIYVALEAHPNPDYAPTDPRGSVTIPLWWNPVGSLSQAVDAVEEFITKHQLGSGNFVRFAGRVARDKKPWAQISYNRRVWEGWTWNPRQELDRNGYRIPSVEVAATGNANASETVRSYKAEMKVGREWSANQRRYPTAKEADAAGKDLYRRWTSAEDYRVVPSSDPPNVEPVITQQAEKTEQSESRILFLHVGDEPKTAQTARTPSSEPAPNPASAKPEGNGGYQPTGEPIFRYTLHVSGLWGRYRRSKFDSFVLAKKVDPKQPWPLDRLLLLGRSKLAEIRAKPGLSWRIVKETWYVQPDGTEQTVLQENMGEVLHSEVLK